MICQRHAPAWTYKTPKSSQPMLCPRKIRRVRLIRASRSPLRDELRAASADVPQRHTELDIAASISDRSDLAYAQESRRSHDHSRLTVATL